eukprot:7049814-Pyramimonas_sp.AAC.1
MACSASSSGGSSSSTSEDDSSSSKGPPSGSFKMVEACEGLGGSPEETEGPVVAGAAAPAGGPTGG